MANPSAFETDFQPSFHVGILHTTLAFGAAYSDKSDTVIDTCSTESVADKENDVRLAGFELPGGGEGRGS
jgi:hypothetical protein